MTPTDTDPRLMEQLSDKILEAMPLAVWHELFAGARRAPVRFVRRELSMVQALAEPGTLIDQRRLHELVSRHDGVIDPQPAGSVLALFEDPLAAVRMAMELQRDMRQQRLRVGVVSGPCMLAQFEAHGQSWCTPVGELVERVAQTASQAAAGSIVLSPESYTQVELPLAPDGAACMLMEEFELDGALAQATIAFAPQGYASTFAGLGCH